MDEQRKYDLSLSNLFHIVFSDRLLPILTQIIANAIFFSCRVYILYQ